MDELAFLFEVVVLLAAAVVAVLLFKRLRVSPILGYLAAGLAIGPSGLALVDNVKTIVLIAELGVVILMFSIGLELSFRRLALLRRELLRGLGIDRAGMAVLTVDDPAVTLSLVKTLKAQE